MEETKRKLKVYCETSFWSYLNGGRTPLSHIAVKQALTRQWWQDIAPTCDHMANPVTLPKTASIIRDAGYQCPIIITPEEFLRRKEEFGYGN